MFLVILYLIAIVAANLSAATFGPDASIINAFLFIGFDLTCKDRLQDYWQRKNLLPKMFLLIATGSIISYLLNKDAGPVAIASLSAFAAAALVDTGIYQLIRRYPWLIRSNGANLFGAAVDSLVFPTLAFGSVMPLIIIGQFLAKVAGGFVWSMLLVKFKEPMINPQIVERI